MEPPQKYDPGHHPNSAAAHFQGKTIGTKYKQPPIPVRFPAAVYEVLKQMSDRQDYIRAAVLAKLEADGLLKGGDLQS
jgi:hypothetical protein